MKRVAATNSTAVAAVAANGNRKTLGRMTHHTETKLTHAIHADDAEAS
jgi:hypothetical protein